MFFFRSNARARHLLPDPHTAPGRAARDEAYAAEWQLAVLGRLAEAGLEPDWLALAQACAEAEAALMGRPVEAKDEPYDGPVKIRRLCDTPDDSS